MSQIVILSDSEGSACESPSLVMEFLRFAQDDKFSQDDKWQPSATLANLRQRALLINKIRQFFAEREVLEVETPLLSHATVTDLYINSIPAFYQSHGSKQQHHLYLQTSPEFAMKRLLAAGSGPIYQIGKAFRQGDNGQLHNPEFTMLEWYRPGFDHHALMDEMDLLLQSVLQTAPAERITYAKLFETYLGINPHHAELETLKESADKNNLSFSGELADKNAWLDLLLTHCIEPHIAKERPLFLYDFPASKAALAKIRYDEQPAVASRFEVYFKGMELANGFHELQNATEQRKRFQHDLKLRAQSGMLIVPLDENFLAALDHGLPDCAGVALGVDRLVMLALDVESINEVISFNFERI